MEENNLQPLYWILASTESTEIIYHNCISQYFRKRESIGIARFRDFYNLPQESVDINEFR